MAALERWLQGVSQETHKGMVHLGSDVALATRRPDAPEAYNNRSVLLRVSRTGFRTSDLDLRHPSPETRMYPASSLGIRIASSLEGLLRARRSVKLKPRPGLVLAVAADAPWGHVAAALRGASFAGESKVQLAFRAAPRVLKWPRRTRYFKRLARLNKMRDANQRIMAFAGETRALFGRCPPASKAFGRAASHGDAMTYLAGALPAALRQCSCRTRAEDTRAMLWWLGLAEVAYLKSIRLAVSDDKPGVRKLRLPKATPFKQVVVRVLAQPRQPLWAEVQR